MIVTLIGYRGSGKSSVGRELAHRLSFPFADADAELEGRAGKSIRQIFDDDGESAFRDLEEQVIADLLLSSGRLVLAAGGGAVLRESTRARLAAAGPIVWLRATAEHLAARIAADASTAERRPNLTALGGLDEIRELLEQREPIYRAAADLTVETEGLTPAEIAERIARELDLREPAP